MTQTMSFLLSHDAKAGRVERIKGYAKIGEPTPSHVVHVETASNQFVELDAQSIDHAMNLIKAWLVTMGKMTARYHYVKMDGTLALGSKIYTAESF